MNTLANIYRQVRRFLRWHSQSKGESMQVIFDPSEIRANLPDTVHQLALDYGSGMMDSHELLHLAATLAKFQWTPDAIVVEIGAYVGNTTVFMAKGLRLLGNPVHILSIDPFERAEPDTLNPQGSYSAYLKNIRKNKLENVCLPLVSFSYDAVPVVPDKIGVLVIDGSHHYSVVKQDLEVYCAKVLPGGFVFVDDYVTAYPDVVRAFDEFLASHPNWMLVHRSWFAIAQRCI